MKRTAVGVGLFAAAVVLVACPGPGGPDPDQGLCRPASTTGELSLLEVGPPGTTPFAPFEPDAVAPLETGGQGLVMVPVRVRATGTRVPDCLDLDLVILPAGATEGPIGTLRSGIAMHAAGAGRESDTIYVIADVCHGVPFDLVARAYGLSFERSLFAGDASGARVVGLRALRASYAVGERIDLELETSAVHPTYAEIDVFADGGYVTSVRASETSTTHPVSFTAPYAGTLRIEVVFACQRAGVDVIVTP